MTPPVMRDELDCTCVMMVGWCGNLSLRTVAYRYSRHNIYPPLSVFQTTGKLFSLCKIFKQHLPQLCLCMWVENYVRVRRPYDEVLATPSVNLSLECSYDIAYLHYHSNSPLLLCSLCRHRVNIILSIIHGTVSSECDCDTGTFIFITYVILVLWIYCVIEPHVSLVTLDTFIIHPRLFWNRTDSKTFDWSVIHWFCFLTTDP